MKKLVSCLVLCSFLPALLPRMVVNGQTYYEDDCERLDGSPGQCLYVRECPYAAAEIRNNRRPQICSYDRNLAIVCCPVNPPTTPRTTRTTTYRTTRTTPRMTSRTTPRMTSRTTRRTTPRYTTPTTTTTKKPISFLSQTGKSWDKCVEYSSAVRVEVISPVVLFNQETYWDFDCAQAAQQLIINGEKVAPKEFPHMAALGFGEADNIAWSCGGSLISENFILTAAHCLYARGRGSVRWVRLGDLNLYVNTDDAQPVTLEVAERFPHPNYKAPSHYNDIALLRLNTSVRFSPYVRPACLHTNQTTPHGEVATATGWGVTEWTAEKGSNDLMKVDLRFDLPSRCNTTFQALITGSSRLTRGFSSESMICAGDVENRRDTCVGDSGGPLQLSLSMPYCMYSIVGLTSFGVAACGISNSPAVYTRVSHYVPWIEQIVWPN